MTVKEVLDMLVTPNEVNLTWNGELVRFNFHSKIEMEVWGNYVVGSIYAQKEAVYELSIAAQPILKEVTA